ncbi:MAG: hypothetical protein AAGB12_10640 [Pseudomonadota bacterium]
MEKDQFSFKAGIKLVYEYKGRSITLWFSAFSGLEQVFIDGQLIVSKRSFLPTSSNEFEVDGELFKYNFNSSLFKGSYACTLYKNHLPFKRKKIVFPKKSSSIKKQFFNTIFHFFIGFLLAIILLKLQMPYWSVFLFILIISFIISYSLKSEAEKPQIIEESF